MRYGETGDVDIMNKDKLKQVFASAKENKLDVAVELTLPESGKIEDSEIRYLSFDYDYDGHYLGGYWGDSNPTPAGATYEMFKDEYISYFIGKDYSYISTLNFVEDIDVADYTAGEGRANLSLDTFSGSSVSTNNIIRMLNAIYKHHATDEYFAG